MEWNIPNTPDTKFRLGSITKQFTATVMLQLVEQGKIKLDAKLSDYLPEYRKDTGNKVTIHHLLTHTSGIPSYTGQPGFFENVSRNPYKVDEFVKKYASGDLEFEPGSRFSYNNSGYFLLGAIIEKVTGKTYEQVLKEKILDPVGMKNTKLRNATGLPDPQHYTTAQDLYLLAAALIRDFPKGELAERAAARGLVLRSSRSRRTFTLVDPNNRLVAGDLSLDELDAFLD